MEEFVFGSLSTTEKRVAYLKERAAGIKHLNRVHPRRVRAEDAPRLTVTVQLHQPVTRVDCMVSLPETAVYPLQHQHDEWDVLNWAYSQTWEVSLPPQPAGTLVRYQIVAYVQGHTDPLPADDGETFSYFVEAAGNDPDWARDVIMYQVFPDRFYPGDGRDWNDVSSLNDIYGGTLRGIIDKLDYIAGMGFNAIWLNPFFPDDDTHHGYHATDYFGVKAQLGTLADIQELVAAAHARGIRLILDYVANHWSSRHESFQAALQDPDSPYTAWYHWIDYPHDYETFFGVMTLPQVNVNHPDVRRYLIDSALYWLHEIGFDGLRCDYALGPPHDFWTELRAAVKEVRPEAWLFGEVVESPATILSYAGRFDGCLDFPLMQALRDTFALRRTSLTAFDAFLQQHEHYFPQDFLMPSFLDNHDMNRFLWLVKDDVRQLKLAALCQFTLPGPPIVYNGSEVGVSQDKGMWEEGSQGMAESRQPMPWGDAQNAELRDYYGWLIQLRRAQPVLRTGRRQTVYLNEADNTYVYARTEATQSALVAFNLSDHLRAIDLRFAGQNVSFRLEPWQGDIQFI